MSDTPPTIHPADPASEPEPSWLEKALLLRRGEAPAALLGAAYFFCVLLSYYMMRPLREAAGIAGGVDKIPWLMTATLLAMLGANPLYAWLVSRLPRRTFIPVVYHFFGANLLVFWGLYTWFERSHPDWKLGLGYAFYVWLSVFNLFVVSVFWGFMADGMGRERGRRLFGFLGIGGTIGAITGSWLVKNLIRGFGNPDDPWLRLERPEIVLLSLIPLELCVVCVWLLGKRFRKAEAAARETALAPVPREPGRGVLDGLRLIVESPYLRTIGIYMLLFTITSTMLYFEQGKIIERTYPDDAARTAAFANIDLYSNILTLVTQLFLTGRLITSLGVGVAISVLPVITVLGFAALAFHPAIMVVTVFQVIRRGLHYAVDRPARETLFAGLSPDAIYKSKPFIDTFVYRAGDMLGGWLPLGLRTAGVALGWAAVPLAAAWVVGAVILGRRPEVRATREPAEPTGASRRP